jgi:two-component system, NtrC family, response regulator AtoC
MDRLSTDECEEPTLLQRAPAPSSQPTRLSLLVMSTVGVFTFPLPSSGEVTVGRAANCHVHIEDAKASRYHLRLLVGPKLQVIDQGSANGTFLAGRRLTPNEPVNVAVGDMLTLGSTVLVLQAASAHAPVHVWSQTAFKARVEEERARRRQGGPSYAVVRIVLTPASNPDDAPNSARERLMDDMARGEALERTLQETLRASDVIGSFASGMYELLLIEVDSTEAHAIARDLESKFRQGGFELTVAVLEVAIATTELEPSAQGMPRRRSEPPIAARPEMGGALNEPTIDRIASSTINVLILGETGVGKEVMARRLHQHSPRADLPLLCLNCVALPESLLESELFGFERGAFTGAAQSKPGLLESAQGGTIFLDEIGEMPMALQAKLLRVLEQREVLRIGALKPRPIDVRFVSATNRDLEAEIGLGRFRRDLFFRLNGISVTIPPLRERAHEIEPLARAFVAEACAQSRRDNVPDIAPAALALLKRYAWPGNIRELRNVMERALVLCDGELIGLSHLPAEKMAPIRALGTSGGDPQWEGHVTMGVTANHRVLEDIYDGRDAEERARILDALTRCKGNQTQAAQLLGISRRTLVTKVGQYNLPRPRKKRGNDDE